MIQYVIGCHSLSNGTITDPDPLQIYQSNVNLLPINGQFLPIYTKSVRSDVNLVPIGGRLRK